MMFTSKSDLDHIFLILVPLLHLLVRVLLL